MSQSDLLARRAANNARKQKSRAKIRERLQAAPLEIELSKSERAMLKTNCARRSVGDRSYTYAEYVATLIRRDHARLEKQLSRLGECRLCGEQLPQGCGGDKKGDILCWMTKGASRLEL